MPIFRSMIFVLASCLAPFVSADLTPRQQQVLKIVLAADGYLTEELYQQFWGAMPFDLTIGSGKREGLSQMLNEEVGVALEFQKETWASIKLSLDNRRVTQTPGYSQARARVMANTVVKEVDRKRSVKHADELMMAAANKTPFNSPQGQFFVTPELVLQVLGGIEASFSRLRRLMDSTWSPISRVRTYDEVSVSVLSVDPFTWEFQEIEAENGISGQLITLMNRVNKTEFLSISRIEYKPLLKMDHPRLFNIAKGGLSAIGAVSESMVGTNWRGLKSVVYSGKSLADGVELFYSARVIALRNNEGALLLQAVSDGGKIDTDSLLDDLISKIQLN